MAEPLPGDVGLGSVEYDEAPEPVVKAAQWLVRTHHHDYRLMNESDVQRRVEVVVQQFRPFIEALLHLPLAERMEAMGMEAVGLVHQTCDISCVHYGERTDG